MLQESASPTNVLLECLSDTARDSLQMTHVEQGSVLFDAGVKSPWVYFPAGCAVTLMHTLANGSAAEVSMVGHEGMVGVEVFLSGSLSFGSAVACSSGGAWRLRQDLFKRELVDNVRMRFELLRFAQALMTQIAQTAACNRHHTVSQQLCRWLLLSMDRTGRRHINMTHELISNMLGVRREGVTEAACKLQKQGVIAYARGRIDVLDLGRLEALSCECYGAIRRSTEQLLRAA